MATSTPNHGLYKYGGGDAPDLTALGPSMDKIDLELKKNADNIGLLKDRYWDITAVDTTAFVSKAVAYFNALPVGSHVIGGTWQGYYHFTGTVFKHSSSGAGTILIIPGTAAERAWKLFNPGTGWQFYGEL